MTALVIETPVASDLGQRFIVSSGAALRSSNIISRIQDRREGPDFIAARWQVTQRLPNRTVRDDREGIALVGVDTRLLSEVERDRIREALASLQPAVRELIGSIDWSRQGHGLVVESDQLAEWLDRPEFSGLPPASVGGLSTPEESDGPPPRRWTRRSLVFGAASVAGLAGLTVGVMRWLSRPTGSAPPGGDDAERAKRVAAILQSFQCTKENLDKWVAAARGLTEASSAGSIDDGTLRRLEESAPGRCFFLADDVSPETSQLPDFVEKLAPQTAADGIRIRQALLDAHRHFLNMHDAASTARTDASWKTSLIEAITSDGPFDENAFNFISALMDVATEPVSRCNDSSEIQGPFFGLDDACRFADISRFFSFSRKKAIERMTPLRFDSQRLAEALHQVASSPPLAETNVQRIKQAGMDAYARTDTKVFKEMVLYFIDMCLAIENLAPPSGRGATSG